MVKYIPAEIIGCSMLVNSILAQAVASGNGTATMAGLSVTTIAAGALLVGLILTPLFCWYVREDGDAWMVNAIVSTIAFPFWAYLMGTVAFAKFHDGNLAAILILTFTAVSGLVAPVADKPAAAEQKNATPKEGPRLVEGLNGLLPWQLLRSYFCAGNSSLALPSLKRGGEFQAMASREKILLFDSGLGGLTVYREVAAARPQADYVYVADDAAFPYGAIEETALVARVVALMGELIEAHRPDLVVIPCNTASTIVLPDLRKKFSLPFVGTVPAIKPACAASVTRRVSVLGTEATVRREYTRALIRDYAGDCQVTLVGSKHLGELCRGRSRRRAGERRRAARGDCAGLRRRRQAHRHRGARVHALPAAA